MPNRLAASTSPYLRQHADNPVDWHPWDADALALARREGKPILLSIGYSACHWCHVMAHECFEHAGTAALMNALFVNIKVDREERPDLDKLYQRAHQALTGRGGGWPLTVFLACDDLLPFYAGTYFPREARHGLPPFAYVLEQVRGFWDTRRDDLRQQNAALADFLREAAPPSRPDALDGAPIQRALALYAQHFDAANGGHRGAPKFPHAGELVLLRAAGDAGNRHDAMRHTTLDAMARRGLFDHVGGGFFRYCVDARWDIPHFEKMLYDNAQLLPLYAEAAAQWPEADFAAVVDATVTWLRREMQAPGGAFYSALDADSEGEEGRYYLWQREAVQALLGADDYAAAAHHFGLERAANFEGEAWHLHALEAPGAIARALGREPTEVTAAIARSRAALLAARERRVPPGRDDKILTAWNALLAAGLLRAARALRRDDLAELADTVLDFLRREAWRDGCLYACHAGGRAQFPAYLDDHAFLLDALLERLQQRWDTATLDIARALAEALLQRFEDKAQGGFWFTAHDHEPLPARSKPWLDESLPSGNGVAARALLRLGHLLGEPRYLDAAEGTLRAAWPTLQDAPHACAALLLALQDVLQPRPHLVVRAPQAALAAWRERLDPTRDARLDAYFIANTEAAPAALPQVPDAAAQAAWLCVGTRCLAPVHTPLALRAALDAISATASG